MSVSLLLDEMFAPVIARTLRERGFDVMGVALLFTHSRGFPRTRRNPGPLIDALTAWLEASGDVDRPSEDWLARPES